MNRIAAAVVALTLCPGVATRGGQLLTGRLRQLRFSPDGQYILAETVSGVAVLTVQPLSRLFTVQAEIATPAKFTPDSREVVFLSFAAGPASHRLPSHMERWRVANGTRVGFIAVPDEACKSKGLSPDGRVLACVDARGTLRLIDVSSHRTVFEKKKFGRTFLWDSMTCDPDCSEFPSYETGDPGLAALDCSPDGRFIVAVPAESRGSPLAFDLRKNRTVRLRGALKDLRSLTFITPDLVVVSRERNASFWNTRYTRVNTLVAFPSGKVVAKLGTLPPGQLSRAADPAFVLVRTSVAGAIDYRSGQLIFSPTPVLDVFGNLYVTEWRDGRVGLFERGKGLQATVMVH
jgi:WD40 repeat protein